MANVTGVSEFEFSESFLDQAPQQESLCISANSSFLNASNFALNEPATCSTPQMNRISSFIPKRIKLDAESQPETVDKTINNVNSGSQLKSANRLQVLRGQQQSSKKFIDQLFKDIASTKEATGVVDTTPVNETPDVDVPDDTVSYVGSTLLDEVHSDDDTLLDSTFDEEDEDDDSTIDYDILLDSPKPETKLLDPNLSEVHVVSHPTPDLSPSDISDSTLCNLTDNSNDITVIEMQVQSKVVAAHCSSALPAATSTGLILNSKNPTKVQLSRNFVPRSQSLGGYLRQCGYDQAIRYPILFEYARDNCSHRDLIELIENAYTSSDEGGADCSDLSVANYKATMDYCNKSVRTFPPSSSNFYKRNPNFSNKRFKDLKRLQRH